MAGKPAGAALRSVSDAAEAGGSQTLKAQLGLRELILDGELAAGERISELWVVERLGVSRTPVRAALLRLLDEGFLDPIPSGGYAVRAFSEADVRDAIEMRGTLEGMAARLAAERGVPARVLHAMHAVVEDIDAVLADDLSEAGFARYVALNERFHRLLAGACGSAVVERQIDKAVRLPFASPSGFVMVQSAGSDAREVLVLAQAQHRAVLDAIVHREGARAEALMREHARIALRNLERAFDSHAAMGRLQGGALIRRAGRQA
ncbi:GntR family transcriptional regulator [Verticiella sediminum]|uniref:GntR family transcriptional regulator n=1 Tax=Verticiella sediminum TaxID=1247510 RepID=A0A556AYJ6_9BURK|nr:GntR family transcriptional regulator [Verticiella sediminum]TSH98007.1 GntR family transcriptional regulator [Verticiella sediminum]